MLFRRFMIVTASIALTGVFCVQVIQTTHKQNHEFATEQRLQQWEKFNQSQSCPDDRQSCYKLAETNA